MDFESKQVVVGMLRGGLSGNHLIAYFKKAREQPVESPDCKSNLPPIEIKKSVGSIHFLCGRGFMARLATSSVDR